MAAAGLRGEAVAEVLLGMVHLDEAGILALLGLVGEMEGSRAGHEVDLAYEVLGADAHSEGGPEEEGEEAGHSPAEDRIGVVPADEGIPGAVDVEPVVEDVQGVADDTAEGFDSV